MSTLGSPSTLRENGHSIGNSILDDDFEIIQAGVDSTYNSLEPASLLMPPSLLPISDFSIEHAGMETPAAGDTITEGETELLNRSPVSSIRSGEDAISQMMRSQLATAERLEKHLRTLEQFSIVADQIKQGAGSATGSLPSAEIQSLQEENKKLREQCEGAQGALMNITAQLEQLKLEQASIQTATATSADAQGALLADLQQKLTEKGSQLIDVQERARSAIQNSRSVIEHLNTQLHEATTTMKEKQDVIDSLMKRIVELEKETRLMEDQTRCTLGLLTREPSLDEMEKMRVQCKNQKEEIDALRTALSEECARRLEEHERCEYVEKQMESLRSFGSIPADQEDKTMVIRQLGEKAEECERLKKRIAELEGDVSIKKVDVENQEAIIKIMQEDHTEATRMLADKEQTIEQLEKRLRKYGADHGFP